MADGAPGEDAVRQPLPLSKWARFGSALLGLGTLGAGTTAIFIKNNNAGSLALIFAGFVLLVMALTGYGVQSVKIGPNEIVMAAVAQARTMKSEGDEEGAQETIEALIEQPAPIIPGEPVQSVVRLRYGEGKSHQYLGTIQGLMYEEEVRNALYVALAGSALVLPDLRSGARRFDALIRVDNTTLAVEIRQGTKIKPDPFAESMRSLLQIAEVPIAGLLVIVNAPPDSDERARLTGLLRGKIDVPFLIWPWQPDAGTEQIRQAVELLSRMVRETSQPE